MVHGSVVAQERNQIVVDEAGMLSSQEEQRLALHYDNMRIVPQHRLLFA